ncbi:T9SS type A sorting domain-containing protein [candidate division WOR-3 bacterium]|nr:T9SS type A sorting domain-containing protein [candidate division WOR-3 bacterium]
MNMKQGLLKHQPHLPDILQAGMNADTNLDYRLKTIDQRLIKRGLLSLVLCLYPWFLMAQNLQVNLYSGNYKIQELKDSEHQILMENLPDGKASGFVNSLIPGKPILPAKTYMIVIPPGVEIQRVDIQGRKVELPGKYNIKLSPPIFPIISGDAIASYCTPGVRYLYPKEAGKYIGRGGLRKYEFIKVVFFPFTYCPETRKLFYTSTITVSIDYTPGSGKWEVGSLPAPLRQAKRDGDGKAGGKWEDIARDLLINYNEAQKWYKPFVEAEASTYPNYDYVIITTPFCTTAIDTLIKWKKRMGYKTKVVTKDWIDISYLGNDIQQKIRNFLRDKYLDWGIEYVLIVGDTIIPMRTCVTFNNAHGPGGWPPGWYTIPTDLYYAELTYPDSLSWNLDGDNYYGEVWEWAGDTIIPEGDDAPDYVTDVRLGRIPWSDPAKIRHICEKIVSFEQNTDPSYKKASLLAGGMIFYENEDNYYHKYDGADIMEALIDSGIVEPSLAVTLYEKAGLRPSLYPCTAPITMDNIINYWNNRAIFYEFNHGGVDKFFSRIWASDDGDSIPESSEITRNYLLYSSSAPQLDDTHPAVGFLMSCDCGKPEDGNNLGAALLENGSVSIGAATRAAWTSGEWMVYYFFKNLLRDTSLTGSKVGDAFDMARIEYMQLNPWWLNTYTINLYGEPSLNHFGITLKPKLTVFPDTLNFEITMTENRKQRADSIYYHSIYQDLDCYSYQYDKAKIATRFTPLQNPCWVTGCEIFVMPKDTMPSIPDTVFLYGADNDTTPGEILSTKTWSAPIYAPDFWTITVSFDSSSLPDGRQAGMIRSGDFWIGYNSITDGINNICVCSDMTIDSSGQNRNRYTFDETWAGIDYDWGITAFVDYRIPEDTAILWIKNDGNDILNVSSINPAPYGAGQDWVVSITPISFQVSKKDSEAVTVIVSSKGLGKGIYHDSLKIISNDSDKNPYYEPVKFVITDSQITPPQVSQLLDSIIPNPIQPGSQIIYWLPKSSWVTLKIYDSIGRLVRVLIDEYEQVGRHTISWDMRNSYGTRLPSGVYFYKLKTLNKSLTKKLILIR